MTEPEIKVIEVTLTELKRLQTEVEADFKYLDKDGEARAALEQISKQIRFIINYGQIKIQPYLKKEA